MEISEYDDDPVVQEIPVYLSKILDENLFIFQYPIKTDANCYDDATIRKTEIRPINGDIRLEVDVDINSANYDHRKGERIATAIDGSHGPYDEKDEKSYFQSNMMDKIVLQSLKVLTDSSNYAAGIFKNNELHLTPIKSIMEMRPQFDYLETADKQSKEDANKLVEEQEEELQQINVQFKRQTTDSVKKREEKSFRLLSKKIADERWLETGFKQSNSHEAELARLDMLCQLTESLENNLTLSRDEYLLNLVQRVKNDEHSKTITSSEKNPLGTLSLLNQIRLLMKDAKVMSFTQLRNIILPEHDTTSVLKYLQQVAVLVQGNWIVNSELLFPKEYESNHNAVPAELMCNARDYILSKFADYEYIDRRSISSVVRLRPEEITEIITNLAKSQPKKGLQLILKPDTEFEKKYPDIAQRQELFWEAKRQYLRGKYGAQNLPPKRSRRRSNRESIGSENEEKNIAKSKKLIRDSSASDDGVDLAKNKSKKSKSKKKGEPSS
ncbi:hypothetical protein HCN44_011457 [Aphidius gifuensis]|uniref:DNA-directed RNA polymerase III subunit RPC5 n=1 Tax=Aphidius gifuensis TaxID=684658 RepID=A0A835CUC3_APHGI|nr:DNA-directed RNA polymerase III subunit RPC5 [Aphidius gifuensis]KAF7994188.1 hypothetical protein HCN44_011457 [Aphidius gifuensis]